MAAFRSYLDQTLGYFERPHIGVPDVDDPRAPRHLLRLWLTLD